LEDCQLDWRCTDYLLRGLERNTVLTSLNLAKNSMGDLKQDGKTLKLRSQL
jgi:hypothetical protein